MKYIEITIDPKGGQKVETKGFSGQSCIEAARTLIDKLGDREGEMELTEEAHREVEQSSEQA